MTSGAPEPVEREPTRVTVPETTAWQVVDGQVVMLELDSENYFRLDDVGTRMWEVLCECGEVEAAFARLRSEYEVDPDVLRADLDEFIARLQAKGLLALDAESH